MSLKLVIPGGSGQVGTLLARSYHAAGHEVVVLSRKPRPAPWRTVRWNGSAVGRWAAELEGADAVVNLAGRSVNYRYTEANRREIMESRIASTRAVGSALAAARRPPRVWLQASTATIYAHRFDAPNDEHTGWLGTRTVDEPPAWRFSTEDATAWEGAVDRFELPSTRRVKLRSAVTMSPDAGGPFDLLLGLARRGLGGRVGDGRQYVSWIHERDFVRAVDWLIEHSDVAGPVNVAAPNPLPNAEFMRTLRQVSGVRFGLPAQRWMVEVGARLLRTESELVLKSRRVVSSILNRTRFGFEFPTWRQAATELVRRAA